MEKMYNLIIKGVCNTNCSFCNFYEQKKEQNPNKHLEEIKLEIDKSIKLGYKEIYIGFYGYEPTTFPFLEEALSYIKEKDRYISMNSNGVLFANTTFADKYSKYIDNIFITIYSSNNKEHFLYTQKKQSFLIKHIAILNLLKSGVFVKLNLLFMKNTLINFHKIIFQSKKYWKNKNFDNMITLSFVSPEMDALRTSYLVPYYSDIVKTINKNEDILNLLISNQINFSIILDMPKCIYKKILIFKEKVEYIKTSLSSKYIYTSKCDFCIYKNNKSCNGINNKYYNVFGDFEIGFSEGLKIEKKHITDKMIFDALEEAKKLY